MAKFEGNDKFTADCYLHEGSAIHLMEARKYQEFLSRQRREVLSNCGTLNPEDIDAYIRNGGFKALEKAVKEMTPEKVVDEIKRAELRDRTAGGRFTGTTWEAYRGVKHLPHYIVATRMGGYSEAWMERTLLEGNPFGLIEGMAITAYALGGIDKGIIYIPPAYKPLAFRRTSRAVNAAQSRRYLGRNILDMPFSFDIEIRETVGEDDLPREHDPFICGECARSLFEPEEGVRYENFKNVEMWPRLFYANNTETYMNIPLILTKGSAWFSAIGTKNGAGTKIFALTGKTSHPCLVEAPIGSTLGDLIKMADGTGSGVQGKLKAFQIGGAGGGIFPERFQNTPLDFDSLADIGWKVGSGYIVLMDEKVCMVEMVRYSLNQLVSEGCDRCDPCNRGLKNLLAILNRLVKGFGEIGDLENLETIASRIQSQARCEYGRTMAAPVLTSMRYFRSEFENHLKQRCPANFCKDLQKGSERAFKLAA